MTSPFKWPGISPEETRWLRDVANNDSAVFELNNRFKDGRRPWAFLNILPLVGAITGLFAMLAALILQGSERIGTRSLYSGPTLVYFCGLVISLSGLVVFTFAGFNNTNQLTRAMRSILDAASAANFASNSPSPKSRKQLTAKLSSAAVQLRRVYRVRFLSSNSAYQRRVHRRISTDLSEVPKLRTRSRRKLPRISWGISRQVACRWQSVGRCRFARPRFAASGCPRTCFRPFRRTCLGA